VPVAVRPRPAMPSAAVNSRRFIIEIPLRC
jgi:hypothetical protein